MLDAHNSIVAKAPFATVQSHVAARAKELAFSLLHGEHFHGDDGEVAILVGVTRPFKGAGLLPIFMQGARPTMFFIRLREVPSGTDVVAVAAGAETVTGLDFGRNKNLAHYLLEGLDVA